MQQPTTKTNPVYDEIESDVLQLQQSMNILHEMIHEQQASITTLEETISESKRDIQESVPMLEEATSYSWTSSIRSIGFGGGVMILFYLLL